MKKTEKKIFISSKEDRGILIKFLKNKIHLSFWGGEADIPKDIAFSNEDILEICEHIIESLREDDQETVESSKEYVHNLITQMNIRNGN
ncbi:hypothetical protein CMI37_05450 [Candidatus Pacearchaeota archaeon]|jgi:hypothetical protein|nr:hypothetical protein [Candidatus Pacearchaeota archaeon]|tara:strand:- start:1750 stop:2016 length:267 start_codon:yes stop_codon:yes gene_type:complete